MTSLCMQLHFSGERGKYHGDESVILVTKKERGQERCLRLNAHQYECPFFILGLVTPQGHGFAEAVRHRVIYTEEGRP